LSLKVLIRFSYSAGYAMETKSSIIAIGLSIHHTPVEIREKLSIPQVCRYGGVHVLFLLLDILD
jgi:hypothetical protein